VFLDHAFRILVLTQSHELRMPEMVRKSQHLGAHGMGYNDQSLNTLSQKLTPADIPVLIDLLSDKDLRVGIQFGLASQCEASLFPVRHAALGHKMPFLDAEDTMRLVESFAILARVLLSTTGQKRFSTGKCRRIN
jgi:hypothetical protein